MSIDVIERRRAVEERLRRARNLTQALELATADFASSSGLSIDDLDPDSSLRTAVSTLAGVAALRPGFDVLVALPNSPFALRLSHFEDDVHISLIRKDDDAAADGSPAEPPDTPHPAEPEGHVASDLAAMLWQDVGPPRT